MKTFQLTAETNVPEFNANLLAWVNRRPGAVADVLKVEMRSLLKLVMTFTPPKTKKQGEDALYRDIRRSVIPMRPRDYPGTHPFHVAMRKAIRDKDVDAAQFLITHTAEKRKDMKVVPFTQTIHRDARTTRFRVRKWTGLMTLDFREWDEYWRKMKPRVGNAKGGWALGYIALGGTVAGWINRHLYAGGFIDRLKSGAEQYIQSDNASTWAKGERSGRSQSNTGRVLTNALRSRAGVLANKIAKAQEQELQRRAAA